MKTLKPIIFGFLLGGIIVFLFSKMLENQANNTDTHVIEYEIKKLNKMIVAEQAFSDVHAYQSSRSLPGLHDYFGFDKKVLLLVNAKVQAIYDLSKLEVEIDSTNKTIVIQKIPELELQIHPEVQFYDIEQSMFNTFEKDELNKVKNNAIKAIEKKIDKNKIENEARQQLIENLGDLYFLAKMYDWKVEDKTPFAEELKKRFY